jgi:hypothetical protein
MALTPPVTGKRVPSSLDYGAEAPPRMSSVGVSSELTALFEGGWDIEQPSEVFGTHAGGESLLGGLCKVWQRLDDVDRLQLVGELRGVVRKWNVRALRGADEGSEDVMLSTGVLQRAWDGAWQECDAAEMHTLQLLRACRLPNSRYSLTLSDGERSVVMTAPGLPGVRACVHSLEGTSPSGDDTVGVRSIVRVSFRVLILGVFPRFTIVKLENTDVPARIAIYKKGKPSPLPLEWTPEQVAMRASPSRSTR